MSTSTQPKEKVPMSSSAVISAMAREVGMSDEDFSQAITEGRMFLVRTEALTARRDVDVDTPPDTWVPEYESWRHGGWYVTNVRYRSGACGCVSRQMLNPATGQPDHKWRIACDERDDDHTYRSRDDAARAERALAENS